MGREDKRAHALRQLVNFLFDFADVPVRAARIVRGEITVHFDKMRSLFWLAASARHARLSIHDNGRSIGQCAGFQQGIKAEQGRRRIAARGGDDGAWLFLGIASLGAVACLFLSLMLGTVILRRLGIIEERLPHKH